VRRRAADEKGVSMADEEQGEHPKGGEHGGEEESYVFESDDPSDAVRIIGPGDEPPLHFGPDDTGPLPHWTAPPTGEVPRIFGDEPRDEAADWGDRASQGPIWRDDRPDYGDDTIDFAPLGEENRLGALHQESTRDPFFDDEGHQEALTDQARVTPIRTRRGPASLGNQRPDDNGMGPAGINGRDLPMALGVGIGIGIVALILFALGPAFTMVLVVAVLGVAAVEFYDKLREKGYQPATLVGILACAGMPLAAYWKGEGALPLVTFLALVATLSWFILAPGLESGPLPNTAVTVLGMIYIGVLGSFAALILTFPNGIGTMITLAIGTVLYDAGAYFVGSSTGRTPLVPWISPNKTVEGLAGGMIAAFLGVIIVHLFGLTPWGGDGASLWHAIELGLVIAVAAPLGDLAESMLKRNLDIKDFGTLLPAHGGVLDRFDSFLFVLPAVFYLSLVVKVT
jgi:phosphatidate cytidylyltransferase